MKLIPQHFVAQGDMVATFGRFSGAGKATGRRFDIAYAHYFQIRDGKVAAFEDFNDTAALLNALTAAAAA